MIAKLNLQLTDLGYSQMVEHLAKVSTYVSSTLWSHGQGLREIRRLVGSMQQQLVSRLYNSV